MLGGMSHGSQGIDDCLAESRVNNGIEDPVIAPSEILDDGYLRGVVVSVCSKVAAIDVDLGGVSLIP